MLALIPIVSAVTFTGGTIELSEAGATINVSTCTWSFTSMQWDDQGGWLYIEDLTSLGSPTVLVSSTKNYTELSGDYTCASFPYGSYIHSSVEEIDDSTNTFLDTLILFGGLLSIVIVALFGGLALKAFTAKDGDPSELWDLGVKLGAVLVTTGIIVAILAGIKAVT